MAWPKNSIGKFGVMRIAIGIKGGVNIPRMYYFRNKPLSQLPQNVAFTPMGGLFVDIPLGDASTVSPEFVYLKRGTDLSYEHRSGMMVHYTMSVHYVDFRLPFEFRLPVKPYFQPYLVVGAEVGMRLGGQIHMDRTAPAALDQTINVGDANMGLIHAGAFAGVGIRSRIPLGSRDLILKFSASVHQGLLDTYSKAEKEGSVPAQNVNAFMVTVKVFPRFVWALPCRLSVWTMLARPFPATAIVAKAVGADCSVSEDFVFLRLEMN